MPTYLPPPTHRNTAHHKTQNAPPNNNNAQARPPRRHRGDSRGGNAAARPVPQGARGRGGSCHGSVWAVCASLERGRGPFILSSRGDGCWNATHMHARTHPPTTHTHTLSHAYRRRTRGRRRCRRIGAIGIHRGARRLRCVYIWILGSCVLYCCAVLVVCVSIHPQHRYLDLLGLVCTVLRFCGFVVLLVYKYIHTHGHPLYHIFIYQPYLKALRKMFVKEMNHGASSKSVVRFLTCPMVFVR